MKQGYGELIHNSKFSSIPGQNTEVYWTPDNFKRTLPIFLKYKKTNNEDSILRINNEKLDFVSTNSTAEYFPSAPQDFDSKMPAQNQFVLYTRNVDHHQRIRSDILLTFG